jgi:hypothetical protein
MYVNIIFFDSIYNPYEFHDDESGLPHKKGNPEISEKKVVASKRM